MEGARLMHGQRANIHMAHYKTEGNNGALKIPLAKELIGPLVMQHLAHRAVAKEGECAATAVQPLVLSLLICAYYKCTCII